MLHKYSQCTFMPFIIMVEENDCKATLLANFHKQFENKYLEFLGKLSMQISWILLWFILQHELTVATWDEATCNEQRVTTYIYVSQLVHLANRISQQKNRSHRVLRARTDCMQRALHRASRRVSLWHLHAGEKMPPHIRDCYRNVKTDNDVQCN